MHADTRTLWTFSNPVHYCTGTLYWRRGPRQSIKQCASGIGGGAGAIIFHFGAGGGLPRRQGSTRCAYMHVDVELCSSGCTTWQVAGGRGSECPVLTCLALPCCSAGRRRPYRRLYCRKNKVCPGPACLCVNPGQRHACTTNFYAPCRATGLTSLDSAGGSTPGVQAVSHQQGPGVAVCIPLQLPATSRSRSLRQGHPIQTSVLPAW